MPGGARNHMRRWKFLLRPHRLPSYWWSALAAVLAIIDYASGPYTNVTSTFIVPVFLAAWYSTLSSAIVLAVTLPLFHATLGLFVWEGPWEVADVLTSAVVRTAVYAFQAFVIARLASHERELEREVHILEGLLPICMHCKSIRNDVGEWEPLERYIASRSEASFTHGLCGDCGDRYYPELTGTRQPSNRPH